MRFRVLGGVEVHAGDRPLSFSRRRERCLVGLLALEAGRPIPMDRLIELLWAQPPTYARRSVHSHVARVRAVLQDGDPGVVVATHGTGYVLQVDPESVDAHRFRRLVTNAQAVSDPTERAELLGEALGLWAGPVLGEDLDEMWRGRVGAELDALHREAQEGWLSALLDAGRVEQALAPLAALAAAEPGRERLAGLQMFALYRLGRKADALAVYDRTRAWLADELGVDPTPPLRQAHRAVLRDELPTAARAPQRAAPRPVPAELPAPASGFVGRTADLERLGEAMRAGERAVAITGSAGVGKTALAIHFGHANAAAFPDGLLHLNLRGFAATPAMPASEALARILGSLGVPAEEIPDDEEAAASLYRSRLAGRRVLLVLDDAASAAQVRPLLNASPGCLVLITSRNRLAGLVASHGVPRLELSSFSAEEAHALFAAIVGEQRAGAEPDAVARVARQCAHLALALRVAAAGLACHPLWTVEEMATALEADLLGTLDVDGEAAVRAALRLSYQHLEPAARRLFLLLGLSPCPDVTAQTAAALADLEPPHAARLLERLAETYLITEHRPHRYAFHDLMRAIARELAEAEQPVNAARQAMQRLTESYLMTAAAATTTAFPSVVRVPELTEWAVKAPDRFTDAASAVSWFDDERANLVAVVAAWDEHGYPHAAWLIADAMRKYLHTRAPVSDWLAIAHTALAAAQAEGDPMGRAAAHILLGDSGRWRGAPDESVRHYEAAIPLCRESGYLTGLACTYNNLAGVCLERRDTELGREYLWQAATAYQKAGDMLGVFWATANLARVFKDMGRLREAIEQMRHALALTSDIHVHGIGAALNNLANLHLLVGELADALDCCERALADHRTSGNRLREADALDTQAQVYRDRGEIEHAYELALQAQAMLQESRSPRHAPENLCTLGSLHILMGRPQRGLELYREALEVNGGQIHFVEIQALLGLAGAYLALNRPHDALDSAARAHELAGDAGYRMWEGEALTSLAEVHAALGDDGAARAHATQAHEIHLETGRWQPRVNR